MAFSHCDEEKEREIQVIVHAHSEPLCSPRGGNNEVIASHSLLLLLLLFVPASLDYNTEGNMSE